MFKMKIEDVFDPYFIVCFIFPSIVRLIIILSIILKSKANITVLLCFGIKVFKIAIVIFVSVYLYIFCLN